MTSGQIRKITDTLKKLKPLELLELGVTAYNNARELVDESLYLISYEAYARAFFLAFTAFEEFGKAYITCILAQRLLIGKSKDELDNSYSNVAKLYRYHLYKIGSANLSSILVEIMIKNSEIFSKDPFTKDLADLKEEDTPKIFHEMEPLIKEIIKFIETLESDTAKEKETSKEIKDSWVVTRNQSLYTDISEVNGKPIIVKSSEIFSRHPILSFLGMVTKSMDYLEQTFEIFEKAVEGDKKVLKLIKEMTRYGINSVSKKKM